MNNLFERRAYTQASKLLGLDVPLVLRAWLNKWQSYDPDELTEPELLAINYETEPMPQLEFDI
jgi:hypothetical protein